MATCTEADSKSNRTRAAILDEAVRLFQEHGFEKTTMRAIAEACGLSLGAAYYHFDSKDALVLAFYERGAREAHAQNAAILAGSRDFKRRVRAILLGRIEQLAPYRNLVGVLARQGADMASPLSPFSAQTRAMREDAIGLFASAIEGSNIKASAAILPELPKLLWLMQLGLVLYWSNDRSRGQQRSTEVVDLSLDLLLPILRATTLPFMNPLIKPLMRLIRVAESCLDVPEKGR